MSYEMQPPFAVAPEGAVAPGPARPASVTFAAGVLLLMAVVGFGYAVATIVTAPGTVSRFRTAAVGAASVDIDGYVSVVWIGAAIGTVLAVILVALYVVLALGLRRGSNAARIGSLVFCGLGLLAGLGSALTVWAQRSGTADPQSLGAALTDSYPSSWIGLNVGLAVAQMAGYVLVGVLLLTAPGVFFGRVPKEQPPAQPFGQPGYAVPGYGQAAGQPMNGQTGGRPGYGNPGGQPDYGEPGAQSSYGHPGAQSGFGQPGAQSGYGQPSYGPTTGQAGQGQPGYAQPSYQPPGYGQSTDQSGYAPPAYGQPAAQPSGQPGSPTGQPGSQLGGAAGQPGYGPGGYGQSGSGAGGYSPAGPGYGTPYGQGQSPAAEQGYRPGGGPQWGSGAQSATGQGGSPDGGVTSEPGQSFAVPPMGPGQAPAGPSRTPENGPDDEYWARPPS